MQTIYLEPNKVPAHLRAGYSGKQFKAQAAESVTVPMDAGLWSGGTRDTYRHIRLSDGATVAAVNHNASPFGNARHDVTITLQPGYAVILHSLFCGKDMGITFFVHPDNIAALLPAPAADLTLHEAIVLEYTISRKSSYGGKDSYQMAQDDMAKCTYGDERIRYLQSINFPSREQWETAKQSLIEHGLLNKAGAVTPAGRNARKNKI